MTKEHLQTAINEGIPFTIRMADGREYKVTDRYRVALGKTTVVVVGDDDMPHVLPLLTMTGISYLKAGQQWGCVGLRQRSGNLANRQPHREVVGPQPRGDEPGRGFWLRLLVAKRTCGRLPGRPRWVLIHT